jgi:hypothetical protein
MYHILKKDPVLSSALPETRLWSEMNLWDMLKRYGAVILKPSEGSTGYGIIQVSQKGKELFEIHTMSEKRLFRGKKAASQIIQKQIQNGESKYLIQQRIPLAEINGRPIDIRVMVQRRKDTPWIVTGYLAKVAGKGYIITNVARSKGSVLPVQQAIPMSTARKVSTEKVIKNLCDISLLAAKRYGFSPRYTILGFDMGVDHQGKVWIIEANVRPALSLFLKLKDKSMYRKIISYRTLPENQSKQNRRVEPDTRVNKRI